jgi:hypothetical protein
MPKTVCTPRASSDRTSDWAPVTDSATVAGAVADGEVAAGAAEVELGAAWVVAGPPVVGGCGRTPAATVSGLGAPPVGGRGVA